MIWDRIDGKPVDDATLNQRLDTAVQEVIGKQRENGVDIVSDGELSKPGFSSYVEERFSGFGGGRSGLQHDDLTPFPNLATRLFSTDAVAHITLAHCVGPVELVDTEAVQRDISRFTKALTGGATDRAFIGSVSPGQIAFNYPNRYYGSHAAYLDALAKALAYEYNAIVDAGFNLQIDSPDLAMAAHSHSVGTSITNWETHLPMAIEAMNVALDGIPKEKVRLHICWGNYAGPHHHDVAFSELIHEVLKANVGTIYPEGGNPRHEHEWRVFEDVELPDEMNVIYGVIDTKTNYIEHPRVVADRLVRVGTLIGAEHLLAGTDCGFDSFIGFSQVDPDVAWLKLRALADGAEIASKELF
jgi:5-methyltetrahydropteroyltriglutamate--homocysteine methyltransferase